MRLGRSSLPWVASEVNPSTSALLALTLAACTPIPPDPSTSTSTSSGDATDGASETGAPTPTTSGASSTSSCTGSTGAEGSTGDAQGGLYDPCDGAAQCDPEVADGCAEGPRDGLGFCTVLCTDGQPCPADESGLGVPSCILEIFDTPAACALTCRGGACPPDLECTEFGGFLICM